MCHSVTQMSHLALPKKSKSLRRFQSPSLCFGSFHLALGFFGILRRCSLRSRIKRSIRIVLIDSASVINDHARHVNQHHWSTPTL